MTIADVWTAIYPWIVAGLGGFVGAALLLPTKLGEALFSYRLGKALEGYKADQNRELERLKEQLSHVGDRGKRSNEMEFSAIRLVWEKFVEAFLATNRGIAQLIESPDLRAMNEEEFETYLTATDFSDSQKQQLRKAPDRQKTYFDIITWRSIVRAQNENFDARLLAQKARHIHAVSPKGRVHKGSRYIGGSAKRAAGRSSTSSVRDRMEKTIRLARERRGYVCSAGRGRQPKIISGGIERAAEPPMTQRKRPPCARGLERRFQRP